MIIPDDIADELGRPRPAVDSDTFRQWQRWITTTYERIEAYRIANNLPEPDPGQLDYVVLMVVASRARMNNRDDGATQVTVSIDDGSTTRMYPTGTDSVVIDLGPWWGQLWPGQGAGAFSFRPTFEPDDRRKWAW